MAKVQVHVPSVEIQVHQATGQTYEIGQLIELHTAAGPVVGRITRIDPNEMVTLFVEGDFVPAARFLGGEVEPVRVSRWRQLMDGDEPCSRRSTRPGQA